MLTIPMSQLGGEDFNVPRGDVRMQIDSPTGKLWVFLSDQADAASLIRADDEDAAYRVAIAVLIGDGVQYPKSSVREAAILFARHCQLLPVEAVPDVPPYEGEIPDVDADDSIDDN